MYAGVCLYTFGLSKTGNAFLPRKAGKKFVFLSSFRFSEKNERYFFFYRTFVRPRGWFRVAKPPLNGVAETEYTKSHLRGLSSLLKNTSLSRRRQPTHCVHWFIPACTSYSHEPCVASACGKGAKVKSVVLPLSAISYYHACEHITRESRADSCTHCLHAR